MVTEGKIEVAKAKLKGVRAKTKPGDSNEDLDSSSDEGSDDDIKEQVAKESAADGQKKEEFDKEKKEAVKTNLKSAKPQHHAQHKSGNKVELENKALATAHELSATLERQSSVLKHADQALEGVKNIEKSIQSELKDDQANEEKSKKKESHAKNGKKEKSHAKDQKTEETRKKLEKQMLEAFSKKEGKKEDEESDS